MYSKVKESVQQRLLALEEQLKNIRNEYATLPDGKIRFWGYDDKVRYYMKTPDSPTNGVYISRNNLQLIKDLCRKAYLEEVMAELENEQKLLLQFNQEYDSNKVSAVYQNMDERIRNFTTNISPTDEECLAIWNSETYQPKEIPEDLPLFLTDNKEKVRSKSEILIANSLKRFGVPYKYEHPLKLGNKIVFYPDFMCFNVRLRRTIIWEHFGMLSDSQYVENMIKKLNLYAKNGFYLGINLIVTFESNNVPLDMEIVESLIHQYLL